MYSSKEYLHHQFSAAGDWPGGVYITPTVAGGWTLDCFPTMELSRVAFKFASINSNLRYSIDR